MTFLKLRKDYVAVLTILASSEVYAHGTAAIGMIIISSHVQIMFVSIHLFVRKLWPNLANKRLLMKWLFLFPVGFLWLAGGLFPVTMLPFLDWESKFASFTLSSISTLAFVASWGLSVCKETFASRFALKALLLAVALCIGFWTVVFMH